MIYRKSVKNPKPFYFFMCNLGISEKIIYLCNLHRAFVFPEHNTDFLRKFSVFFPVIFYSGVLGTVSMALIRSIVASSVQCAGSGAFGHSYMYVLRQCCEKCRSVVFGSEVGVAAKSIFQQKYIRTNVFL